jgi:hypothetical protein
MMHTILTRDMNVTYDAHYADMRHKHKYNAHYADMRHECNI